MRPLLFAFVALVTLDGGVAHAQYIGGQSFNMIYQRNTSVFNSTMFRTAELQALLKTKVQPPNIKPKAAPTWTWTKELTATDFTPAGARTVPQQLAASVPEADRASLIAATEAIIPGIEGVPGFRKNNLAAAMTALLGVSLQVAAEVELTDDEAQTLMRALNDAIAAQKSWPSMTDEERTTAYDTFVVLSGLMAGMSEQAKTTNDKALQKSVREMALTTLKKFDLTLPAKGKK
ncbi:MAG: hypothetical protein Q8S33_08525 [Myxococcales bacterium]|nr:hypothetical protein [Myxococcales bacterium]